MHFEYQRCLISYISSGMIFNKHSYVHFKMSISSILVRGVKPRSLEGSRRSLNSKHSDKETEQAEKKTLKTLTTDNLEPPTEDGQPLR